MTLEEFENSLIPGVSAVVSRGNATVLEKTVPAIEVFNSIYKQTVVWGMFSCNRGKFKGNLSNNAATEDVEYVAT